jgi:hypothetical protein
MVNVSNISGEKSKGHIPLLGMDGRIILKLT